MDLSLTAQNSQPARVSNTWAQGAANGRRGLHVVLAICSLLVEQAEQREEQAVQGSGRPRRTRASGRALTTVCCSPSFVALSLDSGSPRSSLSSFFLSLALFCCILAAFAASLNCFFGGSALTSAQGASAVPPSGCPCHVCCPSCCRRASQSAKSASTDASASALATPRSQSLRTPR